MNETEEEARKKLVGYCEACNLYTRFTLGIDKAVCEHCGGEFSTRLGFQLTTQRTFVEKRKRK